MKIQTMFKSIFGTAFIALLLLTVPCGAANPSALVGRWVMVSGDNKGFVVELLSDRTGIATIAGYGVAITWKTEKDRFYITAFGEARALSYKLQGSLLTLTEDNGKIEEYVKCNKDCKTVAKEYAEAEAEKAAAALKAKFAAVKKSSFTDSRDGKPYKILKVDNQIWMAENLNYAAEGSKCYENYESNCQKYGRLYDWATAMKACPSGWHLPSNADWNVLMRFVNPSCSDNKKNCAGAGTKLKAASDWNKNGNGVDAIGFAALPGGSDGLGGGFDLAGDYGRWWSATESSAYSAYCWSMGYGGEDVYWGYDDKSYLLSVRCVKD